MSTKSTPTDAYGGWERVDTSGYVMENVNDLMSSHTREITDIIKWEGSRNGSPIKPLVAVERRGEYWTLGRVNWFSNRPEPPKCGVITAQSREEIINEALNWQKENPVTDAFDPLNPPVE